MADVLAGSVAGGCSRRVRLSPGPGKLISRCLCAMAMLAMSGCAPIQQLQAPRHAAAGSETLVLQGCRLIDGTGAPPVDNAVLVISSGRIQEAGKTGAVAVPRSARVVDVSGLTCLPGLVDSHAHLTAMGPGPQGDAQSLALKTYIDHGVTTVRDVGGVYPWIAEIKASVEKKEIIGPRLVIAGPIFTAPGGHPAGTWLKASPDIAGQFTRQVSSPASARAEVAKLAPESVDFIKVAFDSGSERTPFGKVPILDKEVMNAIVEEAHRLGKKVAIHWGLAAELPNAIAAGPDGLEHVSFEPISDELAARIAERRIAVTPTLVVWEAVLPQQVYAYGPQANVRKLLRAGVTLVAGTDSPLIDGGFGKSLHREMELLVAAGLTPMQAIQAATSNPAGLLGLADRVGTLDKGKWADVLVVAGDPLASISDVRNVRVVIKDGAVLADHR